MATKDMKDFKSLKLDEQASVCIFIVQTGCEPSLALSLFLSLSIASVQGYLVHEKHPPRTTLQ